MIGFTKDPQESAYTAAASGDGSKSNPFVVAVVSVDVDTQGSPIPPGLPTVWNSVGNTVTGVKTDGTNTWTRTWTALGSASSPDSGWVRS